MKKREMLQIKMYSQKVKMEHDGWISLPSFQKYSNMYPEIKRNWHNHFLEVIED